MPPSLRRGTGTRCGGGRPAAISATGGSVATSCSASTSAAYTASQTINASAAESGEAAKTPRPPSRSASPISSSEHCSRAFTRCAARSRTCWTCQQTRSREARSATLTRTRHAGSAKRPNSECSTDAACTLVRRRTRTRFRARPLVNACKSLHLKNLIPQGAECFLSGDLRPAACHARGCAGGETSTSDELRLAEWTAATGVAALHITLYSSRRWSRSNDS